MAAQSITFSTSGPFPASPNPAPNPPNPTAVAVNLSPAPAAGSVLTFQLQVTDNAGQTATTTATVTIVGTPTVNITPATQSVKSGAPITLTGEATSPGGTISAYTWSLQSLAAPKAT